MTKPRSWLSVAIWAASFAAALWIMIWPQPYDLAIAVGIILPWLGIAMAAFSGGRIAFNGQKGETRPDSFGLSFLPALAVGARGMMDYTLLDWKPALIAACIVSLLWNLAIWLGQNLSNTPQTRWSWLMLVVLLAFGVDYGFGVAIFADTQGDTAIINNYIVSVDNMYVTSGKSAGYYLDLAGWPLKPGGGPERVSHDMYNHLRVGSRVCVNVHAGRLRWRWYRVQSCPVI